MAILFEGECIGKATNVEIGKDKGDKPRVRWDMIVSEGEHKGRRAQYSGKLDPENIKFTKRDMMAIGWKGTDVRTFVADVKAADRAVPFTAEIATNTYADSGKTSSWVSAKFSGSAKPLGPMEGDQINRVNEWFRDAPELTPQDRTDDDKLPF